MVIVYARSHVDIGEASSRSSTGWCSDRARHPGLDQAPAVDHPVHARLARVGAFVALAAVTLPFVGRLGKVANITPTAVLLMISSVLLLAISIQLSISVSLLQERLRTTAEAHALLARRVSDLEGHA